VPDDDRVGEEGKGMSAISSTVSIPNAF